MQDAELVAFAQDFRDGILDGTPSDVACAMICEPLVTLLNMRGVKCRAFTTTTIRVTYGSCNHVWIGLGDGRVLDPSADQFNDQGLNMPEVYLGPKVGKLHRAAKL